MAWRYDSDLAWEELGERDPYYAVWTHDRYHIDKLDQDRRIEFFRTGEKHVDWLIDVITRSLDENFVLRRVLDYGCGVGRCLIPFARRAEEAVGVDVAQAMLRETARNCQLYGIRNSRLLGHDWATQVHSDFDLVHSFIVFQHITPARGEEVTRRLLTKVKTGGIVALHFTFRSNRRSRAAIWLRCHVPAANALLNVYRRRPLRLPPMLMSSYSLNKIAVLLYDAGFLQVQVHFTNHCGNLGAMILGRRIDAATLKEYQP